MSCPSALALSAAIPTETTMTETKERVAGRELDAEVRDAFFPWDATRCGRCGWVFTPTGCQPGDCSMRPGPAKRADEPAPFSTDVAAAWRLVEKMAETWTVVVRYDPQWTQVNLHARVSPHEIESGARSYPLAICIAALKAVDACWRSAPETPLPTKQP